MSWRTTAFSIALRSHAALCVQLKTDFKSFGEAIRAAQHYTTDAQLTSLRWIAERANMAKHRDLAALGSRAPPTPSNSQDNAVPMQIPDGIEISAIQTEFFDLLDRDAYAFCHSEFPLVLMLALVERLVVHFFKADALELP